MLQKIAILSFMSLLAVTTIDQATRSLSHDIFEELIDINTTDSVAAQQTPPTQWRSACWTQASRLRT